MRRIVKSDIGRGSADRSNHPNCVISSESMPVYRKLVRDRIPELIDRKGGEAHTRRLSDEEFATALARKLVEEAEEFIATPTAEELADVLEVVRALATATGLSLEEVDAIVGGRQPIAGPLRDRVVAPCDWRGTSDESHARGAA